MTTFNERYEALVRELDEGTNYAREAAWEAFVDALTLIRDLLAKVPKWEPASNIPPNTGGLLVADPCGFQAREAFTSSTGHFYLVGDIPGSSAPLNGVQWVMRVSKLPTPPTETGEKG